MRFELTTTTLATLQSHEENDVNSGTKRDLFEPLHQRLHQDETPELVKRADAFAELAFAVLGPHGLDLLIAVLINKSRGIASDSV